MILARGIQPVSRLKPFGPFRSAAGSLYYVAFQEFDADGVVPFAGCPSGGANLISVWKSADGGGTWVEQDAANRKPSAVQDGSAAEYAADVYGGGYYIPQDLRTFSVSKHPIAMDELWVLYVDNAYTYRVSVFDMAADAWGGSSGSGITCAWAVATGPNFYLPPVGNFASEFETTTNDFVALAVTGGIVTGGGELSTLMQVFRLQGGIAGAWTAPVTMPLVPLATFARVERYQWGSRWIGLVSLTRGAAGRLHAIVGFSDDSVVGNVDRLMHWLAADGAGGFGAALDLLYAFAGEGIPPPIAQYNIDWDEALGGINATGCSCSIPFGGGVQAVIPIVRTDFGTGDTILQLMYGDSQPAMPLASWAFQTVETFPSGGPFIAMDYTTVADSGNVYVAYRRFTDGFLVERAWDGAALSAVVEVLPRAWAQLGTWAHLSGGIIGSHGFAFSTAHPAASVWGIAMAAPAVAAVNPNFIRFGRSPIKCANVWDWCLENDQRMWGSVEWKRHGCIPPKCWRLEDNPLHAIPEQGRELHKYGAIPLPVAFGVDTQILQFRVPLGYDGIVYGVLCKFVGPGFVNGSGDLLWRFRVNERWVKSLRAVPTELGDYTGYAQLER
jgi:hypothetical protein